MQKYIGSSFLHVFFITFLRCFQQTISILFDDKYQLVFFG